MPSQTKPIPFPTTSRKIHETTFDCNPTSAVGKHRPHHVMAFEQETHEILETTQCRKFVVPTNAHRALPDDEPRTTRSPADADEPRQR
jgi:hypothetical protein